MDTSNKGISCHHSKMRILFMNCLICNIESAVYAKEQKSVTIMTLCRSKLFDWCNLNDSFSFSKGLSVQRESDI